jgi:hypothetical protein
MDTPSVLSMAPASLSAHPESESKSDVNLEVKTSDEADTEIGDDDDDDDDTDDDYDDDDDSFPNNENALVGWFDSHLPKLLSKAKKATGKTADDQVLTLDDVLQFAKTNYRRVNTGKNTHHPGGRITYVSWNTDVLLNYFFQLSLLAVYSAMISWHRSGVYEESNDWQYNNTFYVFITRVLWSGYKNFKKSFTTNNNNRAQRKYAFMKTMFGELAVAEMMWTGRDNDMYKNVQYFSKCWAKFASYLTAELGEVEGRVYANFPKPPGVNDDCHNSHVLWAVMHSLVSQTNYGADAHC